MTPHADVAIVGAGIIGLAHAYAAAKRGLKVVVFERHPRVLSSSVRNFGLINVASMEGFNLERAKQTRQTWLEIAPRAGVWYQLSGHLIAAHSQLEWEVLQEFANNSDTNGHDVTLFDRDVALAKLPLLNPHNLVGALWSALEIKVDPRQVISKLTSWLARTYNVEFYFNSNVRAVTSQRVLAGESQWRVNRTVVCTGADIHCLFPHVFKDVTLCKVQMLRTMPLDLPLGPAVSSGLSLLHYPSYQHCAGIDALREQFADTHPKYLHHNIHLVANQHGDGCLTIGDSREYGNAPSPYDSAAIDDLMLMELQRLLNISDVRVKERWSSVYPIATKQFTELIAQPIENVRVVNVTSGKGMSIGFALAEEIMTDLLGESRHAA